MALEIHIHKDRLPKPVKGVRALLQRISEKSPVTIHVEKVDPIVKVVAVDPTPICKVQPEMDGSPALPGELEEQLSYADYDAT